MKSSVSGERPWLCALFLAGIWASFLVPLGLLAWTADRGLEMTDEGSYLLIARNPWFTLGHGTFFGFVLHPLWLLSGQHLASFRLLGFVLGITMALVFARSIELRLSSERNLKGWVRAALYGGFLASSLGIYVDGIRTPCYNWLAWWGAGLFLAALFCPEKRGCRSGLWTVLGALGWVVLFLGKWGAALILLAFAGAVLFLRRPRDEGLRQDRFRFLSVLGLGVVGLGVAFWVIGYQGLADTLEAGVLISRETGSHGFWLIRKYAWELFYYLYRMARAFVWILPLGWMLWWARKKITGVKPDLRTFGSWVFLLGAGLALVRGYGIGGTLTFSKESIIAGGWWIGVLWLVWKVVGFSPTSSPAWRPILICTCAPFLLGVGTNTSLADYAGHSTLFTLAGGWLFATGLLSRIPPAAWLGVVLSAAVLQGTRVVTSLQHSYRIGSLWEQTGRLETGPEKGRLQVRPEDRKFLIRLDRALREQGFRPGEPVVGISDLCGVVYLADGISPRVPWFFGQVSGQKPYTQAVLAGLPPEELSRLWIFRSQATRLPGDLASFWPLRTQVPVPRRVAEVPGLPTESGEAVMEIYRPCP